MFTSAISEFHYCISFFLFLDKAGCLMRPWNSLSKFPCRFFPRFFFMRKLLCRCASYIYLLFLLFTTHTKTKISNFTWYCLRNAYFPQFYFNFCQTCGSECVKIPDRYVYYVMGKYCKLS